MRRPSSGDLHPTVLSRENCAEARSVPKMEVRQLRREPEGPRYNIAGGSALIVGAHDATRC